MHNIDVIISKIKCFNNCIITETEWKGANIFNNVTVPVAVTSEAEP